MAIRIASVAVNFSFDNTNAVLYGASEHNLVKLQLAQNDHACVVTFIKRILI